ncbi:MAG: aldehyde dehydrogenase [Nocardioides sp.]|nr:aldehyde dehydrogenase [Nocardioides sp.]
MTTPVTGDQLILGEASRTGDETFNALDPHTGDALPRAFAQTTPDDIERAVVAASDAFVAMAARDDSDRADLLDSIADALQEKAEQIIDAVMRETALPRGRATGELVRTAEQFRAFATVLRQGWHRDALVDPHAADALPIARPDVRRMNVPVGPVVVFGASNFPLAFSTPGTDTSSALAAGCPVVVKGHPSHPETSELCGRAIQDALRRHDFPAGCFSLLQSTHNEIGAALVEHPLVAAVGFTGSEAGGRALFDLANRRPSPIPVYAEMGSVNPLLVTAAALEKRGHQIAEGLANSFLFCSGQYCTKPGLVLVPSGDAGDEFVSLLARAVRAHEASPLLAPNVAAAFDRSIERIRETVGSENVVCGTTSRRGLERPAVLVTSSAADLEAHADILTEHFGPLSIVVRYRSTANLLAVLQKVPGSLTATLHAEPEDQGLVAALLPVLTGKAGRLLWNGYPTGVSVTGAMMHGGPYPASTFPAHTSVGWTAIRRFMRPVTFQDFPDELLPTALRSDNPLGSPRLVDGQLSNAPA